MALSKTDSGQATSMIVSVRERGTRYVWVTYFVRLVFSVSLIRGEPAEAAAGAAEAGFPAGTAHADATASPSSNPARAWRSLCVTAMERQLKYLMSQS